MYNNAGSTYKMIKAGPGVRHEFTIRLNTRPSTNNNLKLSIFITLKDKLI